MNTGHVTYSPAGRLGNVLYQMAACVGYSKRYGVPYSAPFKTDDPYWNPINHVAHMRSKLWNSKLSTIHLYEKQHTFFDLDFHHSWKDKNIWLHGYFQSPRYFEDCFPEFLTALQLPYKLYEDVVGIHIRRGDHLQYPEKHVVQTYEYLKAAVLHFVELGHKTFAVASDDVNWCRAELRPLRIYGAEFTYSEGRRDIEDLALMSCCEHFIGSSSTFSTWAYMLNQNRKKIGIFPELWFVPGHGGLDTSEIVPKECLRIDTNGVLI